MKHARAPATPRGRATNLSLDQDLVAEARELREARARRWLQENKAGFAAFDRFVEKNGIFNEDDRGW